MRILELYSGIGGMHWAFKRSGLEGEVVAAIDINPTCNYVYQHNFPDVTVIPKCITSLSKDFLEGLMVGMVMMSPPCQPHTSLGNQRDNIDPRSKSLLHLITTLALLNTPPSHLLLENVGGFVDSKMRMLLLQTLTTLHYHVKEYLICPTDLAIPNSRRRYYMLARKRAWKSSPNNLPGPYEISTELPLSGLNRYDAYDGGGGNGGCCGGNGGGIVQEENWNEKKKERKNEQTNVIEKNLKLISLAKFLECGKAESYFKAFLVPPKLLKKFWLMDLVGVHSDRCCCFTKGYGRYIEKSGSIFQTHPSTTNLWPYKGHEENEEFMWEVDKLQLRFFTPREVANLMTFPKEFDFPAALTALQCYKLLGNSLNVHVVSCLVRVLVKD